MELKEIIRLGNENCFRSRIILATLSGKALKLENIHVEESEAGEEGTEASGIGLKDYEVAFLKLIEKVTNGSVIEINDTGTCLFYRPGLLVGGEVEFEVPPSRAIGYYLEMILALAPWSKKPWQLSLMGVTASDRKDPSVDHIRLVSLAALRQFGLRDGLDVKVVKRGARPLGGGQVIFYCPTVKQIGPLRYLEPGKMKRIRGIASCTRVSPQVVNRLVESSRTTLSAFLHDIVIYTDVQKGLESGKSPGFGLTLVAESTTGVLLSAEGVGTAGSLPEDLSQAVCNCLLVKVREGGNVDPSVQWLYLLLMTLASEDVSSVLFSELTPYTIQFLRDLRLFLGVQFKLQSMTTSSSSGSKMPLKTVLVSGLGIGYVNYSLKST